MNRGRPTTDPNRIFIRNRSRRGARIPIGGGETPSEPAGEDARGTSIARSRGEVPMVYPGEARFRPGSADGTMPSGPQKTSTRSPVSWWTWVAISERTRSERWRQRREW